MNSRRIGPPSYFGSRLELKCLFFFGAALALVITISFVLYFMVTKKQLDTQNPLMGKLLAEREFLLIHLNVLLQQERESEEVSGDVPGLDDFIESMALQSEGLAGQTDTRTFQRRLIRLEHHQPGEDDTAQNDFEQSLLARWRGDASLSEQNDSDQRTDAVGHYHYYQALRLERSCLNCHQDSVGSPTPRLGSLMGVVHVVIPEPPAQKEVTRLWAMLLAAAIVTAFLGLIAFYAVIRWVIIKPLASLRDVSEAISRGDITKRADLHTGDEFETLGIAFNRMLRHLVATQEKLRGANTELENKVDELAKQSLQLFETNKVKSDFLTTMSHELRTPLNSILGFSEVLGSIPALDDKQRRYVGNINKSGQTLLEMINNILDMARLEAGRLEAVPNRFRIETIVSAQIDMARPLADRKRLDLTAQIEENLPPLFQDAARLQQILNNLLSNAIKFTPEGGRIFVEVRQFFAAEQKPFFELRVTDSGVGIAPEETQVIFEKFRQASAPTSGNSPITRDYSGSGLGLSIVRELARLLGGDVEVESRLGFGSTFRLLLPWEFSTPTILESPMNQELREFSRTGSHRRPTFSES